MTRREWQERDRQNRELAALGIGERDAAKLRRISNRIRRIGEIHCNEPLTAESETRLEREEERLEARAREIVANPKAPSGIPLPKVYFQSDPRGCALYVLSPAVLERYKGHSVASIYNNGIAVY